jgi:hypothetical protein
MPDYSVQIPISTHCPIAQLVRANPDIFRSRINNFSKLERRAFVKTGA